MDKTAFYRTIWRWHFYAGLFVIPMVLVLALTGAAYLFRPQLERWEERAWQALPTLGAVSPDRQVVAALAAHPGSRLHYYRLPEVDGDAAIIHIRLSGEGKAMRDVFVSPQGEVLASIDPETRIMRLVQRIHGQLLLGRPGSWLVELAASWAIVMLVTGLFLWWPRGSGIAGVVWPRLGQGARVAWRDMHAVTGFWVSGLALVLLLTGLPWADVWGSAFKAVRTEMGWVRGQQDWTIGGRAPPADEHAGHDHAAMMAGTRGEGAAAKGGAHNHGAASAAPTVTLAQMAAQARREGLAFPVLIAPPGTPGRAGGATENWTIRSDSANRPLRVTIRYDAANGKEIGRETFADGHAIDRVVAYGVAWHEGQLFGWINQLIGLITALMLATVAISGFVMWRRRKPQGVLGAPPIPQQMAARRGLLAGGFLLALLLPLFAFSLAVLWLFDRLVLPRLPRTAHWLGAI